jgi:hypothetical protein
MGEKHSLGEFEHHVILAALRLGEDAYTTSILSELEARTGRAVSAPAANNAPRPQARAGMVPTRLRLTTARNERRARRYVRVTRPGIEAVRAARQRLVRLWEGLAILSPER